MGQQICQKKKIKKKKKKSNKMKPLPSSSSRKHAYIILTPFNPGIIQSTWGLQGYTLVHLFLLKNIDCGYSLEPPRRGGSNGYPQSMF